MSGKDLREESGRAGANAAIGERDLARGVGVALGRNVARPGSRFGHGPTSGYKVRPDLP
jgi:hypothetical protein